MMLDTDEKKQAFRDYVQTFGAWEESEINGWTDTELNALLIQCIASEMRESGLDCPSPDWDEYEQDDSLCHRIFKGIDNAIYIYIGE